jgi:hypothetical protein
VRELDLNAHRDRRPVRERRHGRLEAGVGQDRRMQAPRQLAKLGEGVRPLLLGVMELAPGASRIVVDVPLRQAKGQGERDAALLGPVVEVPLEPAALFQRRLDEPGARGRQLRARLRVRERVRRQLGEPLEPVLGPGVRTASGTGR